VVTSRTQGEPQEATFSFLIETVPFTAILALLAAEPVCAGIAHRRGAHASEQRKLAAS
jgi:hypothetical protein